MKYINISAKYLAAASSGNPVLTTCVVFLFYLFFNLLEGMVEILVFGDRFEHWFDPFFIGAFIAYSAYSVYACAEYNTKST